MRAYRGGDVCYEPNITDRLVGAITSRLDNLQMKGITWRARTLRTGKGIGSEEKRHGADLLGVLDVSLPGFKVKKGFLMQAKRAEPGPHYRGPEWKRFVDQCGTMLDRSPDSFAWIYSQRRGVRVFPANAVVGLRSMQVFDLYNWSLSSFFASYIQCFIGDHRLNSTDIANLDALARYPVKRVMSVTATYHG